MPKRAQQEPIETESTPDLPAPEMLDIDDLRLNGPARKLTGPDLYRLAQELIIAMPMPLALAGIDPKLTEEEFERQVKKRPRLARLFALALHDYLLPRLKGIDGTSLRTMPGVVWLLERGYLSKWFAPTRAREAGNQVNVQVNVGISGNVASQSARILASHARPKRLAASSVVVSDPPTTPQDKH